MILHRTHHGPWLLPCELPGSVRGTVLQRRKQPAGAGLAFPPESSPGPTGPLCSRHIVPLRLLGEDNHEAGALPLAFPVCLPPDLPTAGSSPTAGLPDATLFQSATCSPSCHRERFHHDLLLLSCSPQPLLQLTYYNFIGHLPPLTIRKAP